MSYATLLVTLTAMLVFVPPLAATGFGVGIGFAISMAVLVAAALAASETPRMRRLALALLALVLAAELLAWCVGSTPVLIAARVSDAVYLVYVAGVVLRHVLSRERSTRDAVLGGVCVYLLLGLVFYALFCIVETGRPGAFLAGGSVVADSGGAARPLGRYPTLLYYSFVTLTTLGYGDTVPVSPFARSLAVTAAVVGQLYLVVLMAGLVGLHLAQRRER
jgi:hypothetical protein